MTTGPSVIVERRPPLVMITLNRPQVANCINAEMTSIIDEAFRTAECDDEIRCVLLAATGSVFCGGSDLGEFLASGGDGVLISESGFAGITERRRSLPLVVAVNGAARAGGFEIALAADIVVAGRSATFGLPEVRHGIIAGAGGAVRLAQSLPAAAAYQLLLAGEVISADRAFALGLVGSVVGDEELRDTAVNLASRIASASRDAVRITRDLVEEARGAPTSQAWVANAQAVLRVVESADFQEGLAAFTERRAPVWRTMTSPADGHRNGA